MGLNSGSRSQNSGIRIQNRRLLIYSIKIVHTSMLSAEGFLTPPSGAIALVLTSRPLWRLWTAAPNLPLSQGEEYPPSWVKRGGRGVTPVGHPCKSTGWPSNYETINNFVTSATSQMNKNCFLILTSDSCILDSLILWVPFCL